MLRYEGQGPESDLRFAVKLNVHTPRLHRRAWPVGTCAVLQYGSGNDTVSVQQYGGEQAFPRGSLEIPSVGPRGHPPRHKT